MIGQCLFCGEKKKLIKAHIIPRWAFEYLYDEIDSSDSSLLFVKKNFERKIPLGPIDSKILCEKCDNFFGIFDGYGKKIFLESKIEKFSSEAYIIKNIKFDSFYFFIISMIWRASVSKLDEFKEINIGRYESKIKDVLQKNNTEGCDDFSFFVTKLNTEGVGAIKRIANKNIHLPFLCRIDSGIKVCVLYMPNGFKIFLKLDKRDFSSEIKKLINYSKNDLLIPCLGDFQSSDEFKSLFNLFKNNKK